MTAVLILIALATVAGISFFLWKTLDMTARIDRWTTLRRAMQDELSHDAIDDGLAHDLSARARDKGAV